MDYPYEASDEASESELLDSSLSRWRGGWNPSEAKEVFDPIPLDLYTASSIGQYDCVHAIIVSGELDLNKKNSGGWTALMYASYIGHDNIVNLLLDAGVDVNIKSSKGRTSLMLAASCGNESVIYFLLHNDADIESTDNRGWTALFHATNAGHQNMVKFLLDNGANANHREPLVGNTALMMAAAEGHEIIVQNLLQYGVDMDTKNFNGDTARSLALLNGYMKIVSLIDNQTLPMTSLRSEPGLQVEEDLSSSEEYYHRPARPHSRSQRSRSKHGTSTSPSLRDGPEALARLMHESRSKAITENKLAFSNPLVPSGYVTFQDDGSVSQDAIRHRDVTSPISPSEHDLDSSAGKDNNWLEKYGGGDEQEDSTPFCVSGAVTIKSNSSSCSSTGGLAAALGLQQLSTDSTEEHDAANMASATQDTQGLSTVAKAAAKLRAVEEAATKATETDSASKSAVPVSKSTPAEDSAVATDSARTAAMKPNTPTESANVSSAGVNPAPTPKHAPDTKENPETNPVPQTQHHRVPYQNTANQPTARDVDPRRNMEHRNIAGQNPLEGINLDAYCKNFNQNLPGKSGADPPFKDLAELLESLNLSKYYHTFVEQDVDLKIFLTLTDNDLKEVGIKLFGPRRKMTSAIARWHSQARSFSDSLEQAYADKVEAEMQEMAIQLHKATSEVDGAKAQVLQEKELRNVVEGCLMEDKRAWQHVHGLAMETKKICYDIKLLYESIRLCQDELINRLSCHGAPYGNSTEHRTLEHLSANQYPDSNQHHPMRMQGYGSGFKDRRPLDDRHANQKGRKSPHVRDDQSGNRSQMVELASLSNSEVVSMIEHYMKQLGKAASMATFNMDQLVGQERSSYPVEPTGIVQ
ncbi:LOW QUALITY PROTEIN: ankyrin repeat and SAM domain-containing protein 3-like [Ptychodera flava]|uniref:LOW QUALITY PROTEIN: ankyrin repeat and SAM domain-containing protein 3-like n=1 Tax=Ptychodera flava TaxID=63121 RepID=UPI00396A2A2C